MTEAVLVALVTGALTLIGTIVTTISTSITSKKKISDKIDAVELKLSRHIEEDECRDAKQTRIRILRFYDEICDGKKHSENHYEDILEDIDYYEQFCKAHKNFHNTKGKIAMEGIKSTYAKLKKENRFLKEI